MEWKAGSGVVELKEGEGGGHRLEDRPCHFRQMTKHQRALVSSSVKRNDNLGLL